MKSYHIDLPWMQQLLPDGIPISSSTIITGPGGAGKPLIGAVLAAAWLKQGGTLVHLLINFDRAFSEKLLLNFNKDLDIQSDKIVYIEFDPEMDGVEKSDLNRIRANLLKAEKFDTAIQQAKELLPKSDLGSLVYGSAMNMLLFSPTYGTEIHQKIGELLQSKDNYLFTIANSTFEEQVVVWEDMADNLFLMHGTGIMHLAFKIIRMRNSQFNNDEVKVPLTEEELRSIRLEAETARKHLIPGIRQI